jgi:ankyrin repeat protein
MLFRAGVSLLYLVLAISIHVDEKYFSSCRTGDVPIVKQYLDSGISVHARDDKGNTGIIIASGRGQVEIIRLLVSYGADPSDATAKGIFEGKTVLW